jgi:hypothetical protein
MGKFKVFGMIVAYLACFIGISMLIGWIICKGDATCTTTMENFADYYIWGIVPEWIVLGWKWGIWLAILPTIGLAYILRDFDDNF